MAGIKVLNPAAERAAKNKARAAARVADLRGRKIGLYDNSKPGGEVAQQRLTAQLGARFPGMEFQRYSGSMGGRSTLTPKGAQAIAQECDAVIGIRGD